MTISRDIMHLDTLADLKALQPAVGVHVFLYGKTAIGDNLGGFYYWDPLATGAEDTLYMNLIPSNVTDAGRWRRVFTKALTYPQGTLVNNSGIKTFFASGVTSANGDCTINLTDDNTPTGNALFTEIWENISRATTTASTPTDSVSSYTKAESIKQTTHGFFKPNPVTITVGLAYAPFANAPAGIPVRFVITGK